MFFFFFFNDTATPEIYTLSLHDALPISDIQVPGAWETRGLPDFDGVVWFARTIDWKGGAGAATRSEEHTSELQSQSNLVCRLLLEKKKQKYKINAIKEYYLMPDRITVAY